MRHPNSHMGVVSRTTKSKKPYANWLKLPVTGKCSNCAPPPIRYDGEPLSADYQQRYWTGKRN